MLQMAMATRNLSRNGCQVKVFRSQIAFESSRRREAGNMARAIMPQERSKAVSLELVDVSDGLTCMSQPGTRPPTRPPKIPMAIPRKKTTLKPNGRFFSLVNRAIVGERATAQSTATAPLRKAKTTSGTGETKVVRTAERIE